MTHYGKPLFVAKARLVGLLLEIPLLRRLLYLHSGRLGPLRKLASKAVWAYRTALLEADVEPWNHRVGFLYDLGYRLHSKAERDAALRDHYSHTLRLLNDVLQRMPPGSIVDYGCGPGILTEHLADLVTESVSVIGADIREETLSLNRRLRPDIEWCLPDTVFRSRLEPPRVIVLDGVVNYISRAELDRLLHFGDVFVLYYASEGNVRSPLFAEFDLFEMLHNAGLVEEFLTPISHSSAGPNHVVCVAYRPLTS